MLKQRKYHIIGWIDGEKKNPPRFLILANPISDESSENCVNYEVIANTVCFVVPYTLAWFNYIDKYQCDKDEGIVKIWIPNMEEYDVSPQILSGEKHEGYMHIDLVNRIKSAKIKKNLEGLLGKRHIAQKVFLPPIETKQFRHKMILQHKVILYGATVALIYDRPNGWSYTTENIEYFLFPDNEKIEKELEDAISLDISKREFWDPPMDKFYTQAIEVKSLFGVVKTLIYLDKSLHQEVFDNLNLLQLYK